MNTDYGNYSKKLASAREEFASTTDKLKKSYDDSLKNIEETHLTKEKKTAKNIEDIRKTEAEQQQEALVSINEKSNRTINNKQKEFIKRLRDSEDDFSHERKSTKESIKGELQRTKDAFNQSISQTNLSNKLQNKEKEKILSETLHTDREQSEKKISDMERSTVESLAKYNNEIKDTLKESNAKNELDKAQQLQNLREMQEKKTDYLTDKIKLMSKDNSKEINSLKDNNSGILARKEIENKEKIADIESKNEFENKKLVSEFQDKYNNYEEKQQEKIAAIKTENTKGNLARLKEKEIYLEKSKSDQEKIGPQGLEHDNYEKRLGSLKRQMSEQANIYDRRSVEANNAALEKLKTYENDTKERLLSNDKQHRDEFGKYKLHTKKDADMYLSEYKKNVANLSKENQAKLDKEKSTSSEMLSRKQVVHEREQNQINELNLKNLEQIKHDAQKERVTFKANAIKELSDNVFEVKQNYQNKFDKTREGFQQKFEVQDKLVEQIHENSNNKLMDIQEKTDKKIEAQLERDKREREIERGEFNQRLSEVKSLYEEKFKNQKKDFDKELARTRKESNLQITSLAKRNIEQVDNLMASHLRDMNRANEELRKEKEKNFKSTNLEKENLIEHYEAKIDTLKAVYDADKLKTSENSKKA